MATTKLMTAEELMALPDDGWRYELIEGVLHRMSPAGAEHGEIESELNRLVGNHVAAHDLGRVYTGDTGFFFGRRPDTVRAPDLAFVRAERLPPRQERRGYMPVVPDLVVEIVSPSDRASEVAERVAFFLAAGVRAVWTVEPRTRSVTTHGGGREPQTLGEDDVLDGGDVLPGFRLRVADLFR